MGRPRGQCEKPVENILRRSQEPPSILLYAERLNVERNIGDVLLSCGRWEFLMGHILLSYLVFLIELFFLLTSLVSIEAALWTFGAVYASCVLGMILCVWWEGGMRVFMWTRSG